MGSNFGVENDDGRLSARPNAPTNFLRVSTSVQIPRVTQAKLCKPLSPATLEFSSIDFTVSRAQNYGIGFRCEGNEKVVRKNDKEMVAFHPLPLNSANEINSFRQILIFPNYPR